MGYSESICFSAAPAEELNKKAFLLNPSLFLFAYYEPKPYSDKESSRSNFTTAIINLYGLFWDCGPFVFDLFRTKDSILITDWARTNREATELRSGISGFRAYFCHNCSSQFPLNERKVQDAIFWSSRYAYGYQDINEISEDGWEKMLAGLISEADSLMKDVGTALDSLRVTPDTNRQDGAIDRWIKQIASCYRRNPDYLLNAMAGMYQLFLLNTNGTLDPGRDLRDLTKKWILSISSAQWNNWYAKWLERTEHDNGKDIADTNIYAILKDWKNKWAEWTGLSPDECDEAPMPSSIFFRVLADDVDQYARNPNIQKAT